ncbi:MAG: hypothetical protein WC849_00310 [Candidatus Paceibacterota bacterium]
MEKFRLVKDLKVVLKDFELMVKNPKWLWNGRKLNNFNLLPREVWGNWLVSVVLCKLYGRDITFADSVEGDGFIVDIVNGSIKGIFPTEHVSALDIPKGKKLPNGEQRIIDAINLKISRGSSYAQGKLLIVFFDGAGKFFRKQIRESIFRRHNFEAVFCVGLLNSCKDGYSYIVTEFRDSFGIQSITHKIEINENFTDWKISKIMQ